MAAEVETASGGEGEVGQKVPHRLERKWTFWFDNQSKPKQGAAWGTSLRKVYTFDTVEEFWCLYDQIFRPSKLPANADFHCFKTGIEPKWEDPECTNGGKWSVTCGRKATLDAMWLDTLMALIGEQFDESEEICGVVASVRQRQHKLALWTKTASNVAAQMSIGKKWKEIIDYYDKIVYNFHVDQRDVLLEGILNRMKELEEEVTLLRRVCSRQLPADQTPQPKIRVPEPKPFSGTRNAKELKNFIWNVEQYFLAAKVPEAEWINLTSMFLAGDAKLWWRTRSAEDRNVGWPVIADWETLKLELKIQFLPHNVDYLIL